jgi:hypothetical protein
MAVGLAWQTFVDWAGLGSFDDRVSLPFFFDLDVNHAPLSVHSLRTERVRGVCAGALEA